ncbi:MAG: SUMF1/EgtB/PvdO family nonheme iron enzyme [Planctomycetota bacterium]
MAERSSASAPANVMIGRFGEVMVLDWGLARLLDAAGDDAEDLGTAPTAAQLEQAAQERLTLPGAILGTLGYASPEQARGGAVDERADVFALGAILGEMLTGKPCIPGDSFYEKALATHQGQVVLPREVRADVPLELDSIVARALAKEPVDRYPDAEAFVADLRAYLAGEPVWAHRYGLRERLGRAVRRHAAPLIGLALGVAALLGLALALAFAAQQRARAEQELSERRLAENAHARSEEAARALAAERTRSLAYTDGGRLKILLRQARALGVAGRDVPALRRWVAEANALLAPERVTQHRARASALRAASERDPARDTDAQAELEALEGLLAGLGTLARAPAGATPPAPESVASVAARLALAEAMRARTLEEPPAAAAWVEACRAIAASPRYGGQRLEPVEGLLPLGPDPASGLWEFWHVASGERPDRDRDGRLRLKAASGVVLVLVPAGSFRMGSDAYDIEQPVHEVRVGAFFLSKFELTQAQWLRATGTDPSRYAGDQGPLRPVEQVSWDDAVAAFGRLGLALPSEAQWEYACRAGTSTAWWTGERPDSLAGAENVADERYRRARGTGQAEAWDDGFIAHGPVGSLRANPFGLHDVAGNVWEWVEDTFQRGYAGAPADGSAWVLPDVPRRVIRGGSWRNAALSSRSSSRESCLPSAASQDLGVRPARALR